LKGIIKIEIWGVW